ncbi:MAG: NfeD family protein [bacterium]|nr:NfeD family protein [bacterium]
MEWIVVTFIVGFLLVCAEVFIPGGVLGLFGALSLAASLVMAFNAYGAAAGLSYLGVMTVAVLIGIWLTYTVVRRTRVGRSLFLDETQRGFSSAGEDLSALRGIEGTALTPLRPSGKAEIGGRRIDVVTEGGMTAQGARVRVLSVEGARVVVREIEAD